MSEESFYSIGQSEFSKTFKGFLIDIYSKDAEVLAKSIMAEYFDIKGPESCHRLTLYYIMESVICFLAGTFGEEGWDFDYIIDVDPDPPHKEVPSIANVMITGAKDNSEYVLYKERIHLDTLYMDSVDVFNNTCEDIFDLCHDTLTDNYDESIEEYPEDTSEGELDDTDEDSTDYNPLEEENSE